VTYAEQGRLEDTRLQFDIAASHDFVDIPRHLAWQFTVSQLAEACAVLGDGPHAERLYELLRPLDGRNLLAPLMVTLGPAAYYLGRLATAMGRWEQAAGHFDDALRMDARTGARQHQARTQVAYAEMLVHRGQAGDGLRALELLKAATLAATDLGMARVIERARELAGREKDLPRSRPSHSRPSARTKPT
jgi:tetratricopeptide (TPR) repeat protein